MASPSRRTFIDTRFRDTKRYRLVACCLLVWAVGALGRDLDEYVIQRRQLMIEIAALAEETRAETGMAVFSREVIAVLGRVPRHEFVPPDRRTHAYLNRPLPIGYGQTISQPYIVALMTELMQIGADDKVLEIGTGSGYQAAILAELVDAVYTIEIVEPLAARAAATLRDLGHANVHVRAGDGYDGWAEHAPFDAIIVTAAAGHIPPPLIKQLKPGGRMVIPLGDRFMTQQLILIEKDAAGQVRTRSILPVMFVPLTGGH